MIIGGGPSAVAKLLPLEIYTHRLWLRPLSRTDVADLVPLFAESAAVHYLELERMDETAMLDWIGMQAHFTLADAGGFFGRGIQCRASGKLVGFVNLFFLEENGTDMDFGIIVHPGHRRQGLGSEAAAAIISFVFDEIGAHRIAVSCDSRNGAGSAFLEALRLRREGACLKARCDHGEWVSTVWYALLDEEYREHSLWFLRKWRSDIN